MAREPEIADSGDFGRFGYISFPKIMILGIVVPIKVDPSSGLIILSFYKNPNCFNANIHPNKVRQDNTVVNVTISPVKSESESIDTDIVYDVTAVGPPQIVNIVARFISLNPSNTATLTIIAGKNTSLVLTPITRLRLFCFIFESSTEAPRNNKAIGVVNAAIDEIDRSTNSGNSEIPTILNANATTVATIIGFFAMPFNTFFVVTFPPLYFSSV